MMSHQDRLAAIRLEIAAENYENALQMGRAELEQGQDSPDLLVLMATAGQLSGGDTCSLEEVRDWLEQATTASPENIEAWLELGHFLDAVVDEPSLAAAAFETAFKKSIDRLEATLDGLHSTAPSHDEATRDRLNDLRAYALKLLSG